MENENPAVNTGEVDTSAPSASEEQTPVTATETASEGVQNTQPAEAEGRQVPYDRFSEVINERNQLKEQLTRYQQAPAPVYEPTPEVEIPNHLINPETGEIDPIGYYKWTKEQAAIEAEQRLMKSLDRREREQKAWNEAYQKFPELSADTELKGFVDAEMTRSLLRDGKLISPTQAAEKLFNKFKAAEKKGIQQAQVSERIQKDAVLPVSETKQAPTQTFDQLVGQAKESGDWDQVIANIMKG
jgi:hypothetical protein